MSVQPIETLPVLTLRQASAEFLAMMRVEGYSPRTITLYGRMLRILADFAEARGAGDLEALTPSLVRDAQAAAMAAPTARAGRAPNRLGGEGMAAALGCAAKAMAKRLGEEGLAVSDLGGVRSVKVPKRIQPRLTAPEFRALQKALASRLLRNRPSRFVVARDAAIIQVLIETGLRASECCALDLGDVDFQEGSIVVRAGKGRKDRALSILDPDPNEPDGGATLRALSDYLTHREQLPGALLEPALWLTPKGHRIRPDELRRILAKLCREAAIKGNRPPHAFRRGWFTASYQADPNALPVLSARMGWSPSSRHMVETYTRGVQVELARTHARPLVSKVWAAPDPREQTPERAKPAPVQRRETLQAVLAILQGDSVLSQALVQALTRQSA